MYTLIYQRRALYTRTYRYIRTRQCYAATYQLAPKHTAPCCWRRSTRYQCVCSSSMMGVTTYPIFAPPIEVLEVHAPPAESESTGSYEHRLLPLWGQTGFVSNRKVVGRACSGLVRRSKAVVVQHLAFYPVWDANGCSHADWME